MNTDSLPKPGEMGMPESFIVLTSSRHQWAHLGRDAAAQDFTLAFAGEAMRSRTRLFVAQINGKPGADPRLGEAGYEEVAAWLGAAHRGTLLVLKREEVPDLAVVIARASLGGRMKVAWIDRGEEGLPDFSPPPLFLRCHVDEARIVACALDHLESRGHRAVFYPYQASVYWQARRLEVLQREAQRRSMKVESLDIETLDNWYSEPGFEKIAVWLRRLDRDYQGPRRALADALARAAETRWNSLSLLAPGLPGPTLFAGQEFSTLRKAVFAADSGLFPAEDSDESPQMEVRRIFALLALAPCFLSPAVTAIVAPNDFFVRRHLRTWITLLQIRVPEELSVVSFDNHKGEEWLPWNTVDFGREELGREAFRFLKEEIREPRETHLPGRPLVVDYGTVAPPLPGRKL